jgi:hypothetical protein
MAVTSPQPFSLAGSYQDLLPGNWSTSFKTPLDPTQTLPVKPETLPGIPGGFMDSPEMQLMKEEKNPFVQMMLLKRMDAREDMANLPAILKTIRAQDREDRLLSRPLELEELKERQKLAFQAKVAGGLLDMVTGFPAKLTAHRDMVAPMNEVMRRTQRPGINYGAVPIQRLF